jgi:putative exporter of polyketide antibiotics
MLQGKMTYLGIAKLTLAYLLQDYASQDEINTAVESSAQAISAVLAVMGIAEAVYGRFRIVRARYVPSGQ